MNSYNKDISNKTIKKTLSNLSIVLFFSFFCSFLVSKHLENYISWLSFMLLLSSIGLFFGFGIYYLVVFLYPKFRKYRNKQGVGLIHISILFGISLIFTFGILINTKIVLKSKLKNYKILRTSIPSFFKSKPSYLFILNDKEQKERLHFGRVFIKSVENKMTVPLYKNKGFFGFEFYSIKEN